MPYLSREHAGALARRQVRQSAGGVGNCWDNGVVESFFSSLEREPVHRRCFATRDQARREIFTCLGRCNTQRLNYQNPTEWEDHHRRTRELDQAA